MGANPMPPPDMGAPMGAPIPPPMDGICAAAVGARRPAAAEMTSAPAAVASKARRDSRCRSKGRGESVVCIVLLFGFDAARSSVRSRSAAQPILKRIGARIYSPRSFDLRRSLESALARGSHPPTLFGFSRGCTPRPARWWACPGLDLLSALARGSRPHTLLVFLGVAPRAPLDRAPARGPAESRPASLRKTAPRIGQRRDCPCWCAELTRPPLWVFLGDAPRDPLEGALVGPRSFVRVGRGSHRPALFVFFRGCTPRPA
jgi:hypothetical protein